MYHHLACNVESFCFLPQSLFIYTDEKNDTVIYSYTVEPGVADKSYGIEVAKIAGLPRAVTERAQSVLSMFEVIIFVNDIMNCTIELQ
ncbi:hypothetical protein E6Q11_06015 [Candidatus Dojkabacteria bacterium]|uniref:DNA mismatch repair proteins mutS family domain-containing protein n=1 Tax=Candidatus Dojkabacteria bacterium TaxID=2099670 RepID=A0A5C7J3S7_9BACT|nr:MAG: hypothetical protein E6Q11_06015 [Candidatus Dojkabacteria bacterium]